MNIKIITLLFVFFVILVACNDKPCMEDKACSEQPPTDELCKMAVQAWFYNPKTAECEQKSYSGCEIYGFQTKEECDRCDCK